MKRLIVLAALVLAGCGALHQQRVHLPDGRIVICVRDSDNGGVSCDFDHPLGKSR